MLYRKLPTQLFTIVLGIILLTACAAPAALPGTGSDTNPTSAGTIATTAPASTPDLAMTNIPTSPTDTPVPASPSPSGSDTTSGPIVSTVLPSTGGAPGDLTSTAPPLTSSGDTITLTQADNGRPVVMTTGQRLSVQLGEDYDWEVNIADQAVISRVIGVMPIRGSQGLFEAHQAGQTTLTAVGNPPCLKSTPPCAMPSIRFEVQITVK